MDRMKRIRGKGEREEGRIVTGMNRINGIRKKRGRRLAEVVGT